jgi:hypothetical protein
MTSYELLSQLDGFSLVAVQMDAALNMVIWTEDVHAILLHFRVLRSGQRILMAGCREMQPIPAHGMRFQFAGLCGAAGRAKLQAGCPGLPRNRSRAEGL